MKYFVVLLIFALFVSGCANTDENTAIEPIEPDIPIIISEVLPGNWILESQETGFTLSERIIILDNGIYLDFSTDDRVIPSFWEERNNILVTSSIGHTAPRVERYIQLINKDLLVITYVDGLTGTYIRSNDLIPEQVLFPELVGSWFLFHPHDDEPWLGDIPWFFDFHSDGSGAVFEYGEMRPFTWSIIPATMNVLIMNFGEGEEYFLLSLISDDNDIDLFSIPMDGINVIYRRHISQEDIIPIPQEDIEQNMPDDESEFSEAHRRTRWEFEQQVIPLIIFGMESEIIEKLNNADTDAIFELIMYWWRIFAGAEVLSAWYEIGFEVPDTEEERLELSDELRPLVNLGDEHISDVIFVQLDSATNAFIIEMLDINLPRVSTYIGITHNEEMGLNIFTLERVGGFIVEAPDAHMFCYLDIESRGSFHEIDNNINAFIDAMREAMNGLIEPISVFYRELF